MGDRQRLEPTKLLWGPQWGQVPGAGGHLPFGQSNPGSRTTKCQSFRGEVQKDGEFVYSFHSKPMVAGLAVPGGGLALAL